MPPANTRSGPTHLEKPLSKPSSADRVSAVRVEAVSTSKVRLRVTDIRADPQYHDSVETIFNTRLHTAEEDARRAIRQKLEAGTTRIISIYSDRTIAPLSVTRSLLCDIFSTYEFDSSFTNNVSAFGGEPHVAESSNSFFSHSVMGTEASRIESIAYQFRYVEENQRDGVIRWSTRHMGVYHSRRPYSDVFLLLHCILDPTVERRIFGLAVDEADRLKQLKSFAEAPMEFHETLFETYSLNWRYYLRQIGDQFSHENDIVMTTLAEETDAKSTFEQVQKLRHSVDKLLFTKSLCQGNLQLIERIQHSSFARSLNLREEAANMAAFIESASSLQHRAQNAIDFSGYTLTLHNQIEAVEVNKQLKQVTEQMKDVTTKMRDLTQETVDDSATVMIITFLSAFYIPGSFVGTLFGTNFFVFDRNTRSIAITDDFWIFISAWLPLTIMTGGIYMLIIWLDGRAKGKKLRWPWKRFSSKLANGSEKLSGSKPL